MIKDKINSAESVEEILDLVWRSEETADEPVIRITMGDFGPHKYSVSYDGLDDHGNDLLALLRGFLEDHPSLTVTEE